MEIWDWTTGTFKPKAVFFDLDGTLLNTSKDLQTATHTLQNHFHHPLWTLSEVEAAMGHGIEALVKKAVFPLEGQDLQDALALFHATYAQVYDDQTEAYVGIVDLVERLRQKGLRLGVVSNKRDDYTQALIQHHFGQDRFEFVLGASDRLPKKPDPAMLLEACKTLQVDPKDCVYVGDTEVDVHFAQRAGMKALVVTWGFRSRQELAQLFDGPLIESVKDCLMALDCV